MKKLILLLRRSLSVRLSLGIVLFATLIFIGSLSYMFTVSRNTVRQEAINHATHVLDNTVLHVNAILKGVEIAADNTDWLAIRHLNYPDSMFVYTEKILKSNPNLYGCSIAFEPNYYKQKGYYFSAYSYNNSDSIETIQEGNYLYDYFSMDWYLMPKLLDRPCWTEPYIDLDVDTTYTKEMIISYCKPLKDGKGNFVGVLSVDLSLSWLSQTISAMKPYPNSYNMMIGRGGTYFVHPDSTKLFYETVFTPLFKQPDETRRKLGLAMQRGDEGMQQLEIRGKDFYVFYKPLESTGWSVAILCPQSDIFMGYNRLTRVVAGIVIIGLLLLLYFCIRIVTRELKPLRQLARQAETIASGQFDQQLPFTSRIDEIGQLKKSFSYMQSSLVTYIEELKTTTAQKASIEGELNAAKDIQMSMLPKTYPPYPQRHDVDIYGHLTSAKEVGGDLFDFYIRDEKLFFCIGDVSGKGVPASLLMTVTRSQFRTLSAYSDEPNQIMTAMNDLIVDGNDTHMFVTMFIGCLDLPTGHLDYCCGGHNPPLLIGPGVEEIPIIYNLPVGIIDGTIYEPEETEIAPGTTIFLYTDGLTEAMDADEMQFGEDRMNEIAATFLKAGQNTPEAVVNAEAEAVKAFVKDAPQSDDLTLLAITYYGQDAKS